MDARSVLLDEVNRDLPQGIDWYAGAISYVQSEINKYGSDPYRRYLLSKPFAPVPDGPEGLSAVIENSAYISNFANTVKILNLAGSSKILDVACGSGWVSHFMTLMNYDAFGFDICDDMVEITKERFRLESRFSMTDEELSRRFFKSNIEVQPLPDRLHGIFDAVILESCMHHFFDPVTAMTHICAALKEDGVAMIIEGECRTGPLKREYIDVMAEFHTLERPYTRLQFETVLNIAGLPFREFLGRGMGWMGSTDPRVNHLSETHRNDANALNFAICAKNEKALKRIFPYL